MKEDHSAPRSQKPRYHGMPTLVILILDLAHIDIGHSSHMAAFEAPNTVSQVLPDVSHNLQICQ